MLRKYLFISLIFFFGLTLTVSANTADLTKKGSIEIILTEKENDIGISGAEISLYHIADAIDKNNNLAFAYTENYSTCGFILDNLKEDNLSKKLKTCVKEKTPDYKKNTDNNGKLKFDNLTLGLYLVKQTNKVKGYSNIDEFLVIIPKVIDNKWVYDIEAEPKTEIYQTIDLTVIKKWNKQNKNNKLPENVTIELLKDEEVIDTIILNDINNWTYTWEDIEKSDKYDVREINIPKGYTATYKKEINTYIITNTDKLVQTGQIYFPIIILASLGVMFIIVGLIGLKKENNEN